jgi:hypothetical protein
MGLCLANRLLLLDRLENDEREIGEDIPFQVRYRVRQERRESAARSINYAHYMFLPNPQCESASFYSGKSRSIRSALIP